MMQTWAEKRDGLLREIGIYSTQLDELKKSLKESGLALADLHQSIAEAKGRIAESEALEVRHQGSLTVEVAELAVRKSRLESECLVLQNKLLAGSEQYGIVRAATEKLQSAHDTMKDQAAIVDRLAGEMVQTSTLHSSELQTITAEVRALSDQVVQRANENLAQTKIILEKLPRYIFELQKPIPVRRMYSPARGTEIPPSKLTP